MNCFTVCRNLIFQFALQVTVTQMSKEYDKRFPFICISMAGVLHVYEGKTKVAWQELTSVLLDTHPVYL